MDNDPYIFRMDILQHEAHHHPVRCLAMCHDTVSSIYRF
jgi:hypothetical protein